MLDGSNIFLKIEKIFLRKKIIITKLLWIKKNIKVLHGMLN